MQSPTISIIILNWNGREDTLQCLESAFKIDYPAFEVIVVDNGSTDGSVAAIRQAYPQVELIETGENLGYAGGNNVGIRHALERGADYIFILNNDTTVAPDILNHLVEAADSHPDAAALGPVVLEFDRPDVIWTAGEYFAEDGFFCVHHLEGRRIDELDDLEGREWDWINGAALFTRARVWEEIGLFDPRFFLVYEESDWCFRARRAGYRCEMVPKARVWHKVAGSFGGESSPLRAYFSTRNQLLFAEKNLSLAQRLKLLKRSLRHLFPRISLPDHPAPWAKQCYWSLRDANILWQSPVQRARRRGVWDYCLRRFGNCPPVIRRLNQQARP